MLSRGENGVRAYIGRLPRRQPNGPIGDTARLSLSVISLALPLGTEERRATGLHDAAHSFAAVAARAGVPFAAVDGPVMLEVAERAVGLDIIAQRRTSCRNRFGQDGSDCRSKPLRPPSADRGGEPARRQTGAEQCL